MKRCILCGEKIKKFSNLEDWDYRISHRKCLMNEKNDQKKCFYLEILKIVNDKIKAHKICDIALSKDFGYVSPQNYIILNSEKNLGKVFRNDWKERIYEETNNPFKVIFQ